MEKMASVEKWLDNAAQAYANQSSTEFARLFAPFSILCLVRKSSARVDSKCNDEEYFKFTSPLVKVDASEVYNISEVDLAAMINVRSTIMPLRQLIIEYFAMLKWLVLNDKAQVVCHSLYLIDHWIKALQMLEVPGWCCSALTSIVLFCDKVPDANIRFRYSNSLRNSRTEEMSQLQMRNSAKSPSTELKERVLNGMRKHIGKVRVSDNDPHSIQIYVTVITETLKVSLDLNNPSMALSVLRNLYHHTKLPNFMPRILAAEYKYYVSNLYMQRNTVRDSVSSLQLAIQYCPNTDGELLRRINSLNLLCNLRLGLVPMDLKKYIESKQLGRYSLIFQALRYGNLHMFDRCLERYSDDYYRDGTLFSLSLMRHRVEQSLCYNVTTYLTTKCDQNPQNIFSLSCFVVGYRISSKDPSIDEEEVMCKLSNLVQHGLLRGYVAWSHRKVVMSKVNAFPTPNHM